MKKNRSLLGTNKAVPAILNVIIIITSQKMLKFKDNFSMHKAEIINGSSRPHQKHRPRTNQKLSPHQNQTLEILFG